MIDNVNFRKVIAKTLIIIFIDLFKIIRKALPLYKELQENNIFKFLKLKLKTNRFLNKKIVQLI